MCARFTLMGFMFHADVEKNGKRNKFNRAFCQSVFGGHTNRAEWREERRREC